MGGLAVFAFIRYVRLHVHVSLSQKEKYACISAMFPHIICAMFGKAICRNCF